MILIFYPCFLVKKAATFLISKELVEASRTYTDQQDRFEMLTPASLEVEIMMTQSNCVDATVWSEVSLNRIKVTNKVISQLCFCI